MTTAIAAARKRAAFLRELGEIGNVIEAARRAGISVGGLYARRKADRAFLALWNEAAAKGAEAIDVRAKRGIAPEAATLAYWQGETGRARIVRIRATGQRWSEQAQAVFLDHLAATANICAAAAAAGFTTTAIYKQRMKDRVFAALWDEALAQGVARVEMMLIDIAARSLAAAPIETDEGVPRMSVAEAISVVRLHRQPARGGPPDRRNWKLKPADPDAARASILRKLAAIRATREAGRG